MSTPDKISTPASADPFSKSLISSDKPKDSEARMVHGFRSDSIALASEDPAAYDTHLDKYFARYSPIDKTEEDLVGLLASNMWQTMRINSIEVAMFNLAISGVDVDIQGVYNDMDEYGRLALAFKKSAGDNALELLRRYKSTAERAFHRAFQALEEIRKERIQTPAGPPPNPSGCVSADQPKKTERTFAPHIPIEAESRLVLVPSTRPGVSGTQVVPTGDERHPTLTLPKAKARVKRKSERSRTRAEFE